MHAAPRPARPGPAPCLDPGGAPGGLRSCQPARRRHRLRPPTTWSQRW